MAEGLDLRVEIEGSEAVVRMLNQVGLEVKDLRPAMQDIGQRAKRFFGGNVFASRGGAIGEPWPRLSDRYAAYKESGKKREPNKGKGAYPGRPPLVKTGLMQRSFTYTTTAASVTITNKADHFKYHQSTATRTKIPRRAMMKLTDQFVSDAKTSVARELSKKIAKAAS